MKRTAGLVLYILIFAVAGVMHLLKPLMYAKIVPPMLPAVPVVIFSGMAELFIAIGLAHPRSRRWAAWASIAFLIAVLPANVYMLMIHDTEFPQIPKWTLIVRVPLQFLLMAWAHAYTKAKPAGGARE